MLSNICRSIVLGRNIPREFIEFMIQSYNDYRMYLKQDALAMGRKLEGNLLGRMKLCFFKDQIWEFLVVLRKVEYIKNVELNSPRWLVKKLGQFKYVYYLHRFRSISIKCGFSIPPNTFGPGLSIAHYGTIIVNPNTRVGANCRLHACVNIGASGGSLKAPIIGDNVYIGPSAVIFGDIMIADNVTIGANATVNKSFFQQNIVIAGTPAKVLKTNSQNWLQFNGVNLCR